MRIVLDAMGGDNAPYEIIKGAYLAEKELSDLEIILVGRKDEVSAIINRDFSDLRCELVHADEVVGMCEAPALSIRKKRNSSMVIGLNLVKEKKADAFVSLGNTGAVVCAATLGLRLIEGVDRPGIGLVIPTLTGTSFLMDVGANIDAKPSHLMQYGVMGQVYSEILLNKSNPTVGMLNIGEEESKGTDFMRETMNLMQEKNTNFIGNVEAKELFCGNCDVIVCDGMIGNVALKSSESAVKIFTALLKKYIKKNPIAMFGAFLMKSAFAEMKRKMDPAEFGGAPLLGIDGVVIVGHGNSNAHAVKNAIKVGYKEVNHNINAKIKEKINECK